MAGQKRVYAAPKAAAAPGPTPIEQSIQISDGLDGPAEEVDQTPPIAAEAEELDSGLVQQVNFGWLPDIPDHRDMLFAAPQQVPLSGMPTRLDLTESGYLPEVYDQGGIGSCVANAVAAAIEYAMRKRPNDPEVSDFLEEDRIFSPSRLFLYYGAREIIGLQKADSGCHIRDAIKVAYNVGAPRETGWKYDEAKFSHKPPKRQYKSAPFHKITSYRSVPVDIQQVKNALYAGLPVIFGVAVFNSFFSNARGDIPMPRSYDPMIGGHAMLIVGYNDVTRRFKFRNSWGAGWGTEGHGTIPYEYVGSRSLGADYWVLTDELYKERMV